MALLIMVVTTKRVEPRDRFGIIQQPVPFSSFDDALVRQ